MSRSLKKGPYLDARLMEKVAKAKQGNARGAIKTWARASTIVPEMVGMRFAVHNGRLFPEVLIEENMVGHRLGEFSPTRTFKAHSGKKATAEAVAAKPGAPAAPAAAAKPAAKK